MGFSIVTENSISETKHQKPRSMSMATENPIYILVIRLCLMRLMASAASKCLPDIPLKNLRCSQQYSATKTRLIKPS